MENSHLNRVEKRITNGPFGGYLLIETLLAIGLLTLAYPLLLASLSALQKNETTVHTFTQQITDTQNNVARLQTYEPTTGEGNIEITPFSASTQKISFFLANNRHFTIIVPISPTVFP